jgi:hypothetical protein
MIHRNERRKSSGEKSAKFADLSLQVTLGRVPCSQTSLYRLGIQGKCQVYRSLFTDPPLQVPSFPISLYRSLLKDRWQKSLKK